MKPAIKELMEETGKWVSENLDTFLTKIKKYVAIKSISTLPEFKEEIERGAEFTAELLEEAGIDEVRIIRDYGNPLVFAQKIIDEKLPVVLFYGHYDVQPQGNENEWSYPPFEATLSNGNIYGRGTSDDKIPVFCNIQAVKFLLENQLLNVNLKFIIEGEEEIGSPSIHNFIKNNVEVLKSDYAIISDTAIGSFENPIITTGVRGLLYLEVEARGPNRDLHSGIYGGAVRNPLYELCRLLSLIKDENKIMLDGFYDDILPPSEQEIELARQNNDTDIARELGVDELDCPDSLSFLMKTTLLPSYDINGIYGGYTGSGSKTVLPSQATAKVSFRLVPAQDPLKIASSFIKFMEKKHHKGVKINVKVLSSAKAVAMPATSPTLKKIIDIYRMATGKNPLTLRSGGTIPIVSYIYEYLGIHPVMAGLGKVNDNAHGPDEHFPLEHLIKGIPLLACIYANLN